MLDFDDVTSTLCDTFNSADTTALDRRPYTSYGNMSCRAETQTTFIHQKTPEKDSQDSNSALFYLFQEVSMLASPIHCSFSETKSSPKLLGATTVQDKKEEDVDVYKTLNGSRLRCLSGRHMVNTFREECVCDDSPWTVLNLINLQCERLLHHRDEEKSTVTEQETQTSTLLNTKTHFCYKRDEFSGSGNAGNNEGVDPQCCVNESGNVTRGSEEVKSNTDVTSCPSLSKSVLTLDCNANVVTSDPNNDAQQTPFLPSVLSVSCVIQRHNSLPQSDVVGSKPESTHLTSPSPPPAPFSKSSVGNISPAKLQPEGSPVQTNEIQPQTVLKWRTKGRRKQPYPSRSVDIQDPNVQGVMFSMGSELDDSRETCRLLITWKYSSKLSKRQQKLQPRTRKSYKTSSSDEETDLLTTVPKTKACASCCTRKTPMWRDAEDGTPLCNACGIRYKKYRVRCMSCWNIPRKESNSNSCCLKCGNLVIQTSGQRKHTT